MAKVIRRNTPQRRVILEELQKVCSHPTASEIHQMAKKRLPKISLATVYRNLEFLAKRGMIQKLGSGCGEARYDGNPDKHIHVRCVECGSVADIKEKSVVSVSDDVPAMAGYEFVGYQFEFLGVCPTCGGQQCR